MTDPVPRSNPSTSPSTSPPAGRYGRVHTIGHSTRGFDEVLEMLREHDITCLVDVRSFPSSRKYPQWNRAALVEALPSDIAYRWIPRLGGRRYTPQERRQ